MCSSNLGPGWNLSPKGFNLISENSIVTDKTILLKNALNADLKEVGLPILSKELNKPQISQLVLQIQKIRNVSAPKSNEESQAAPRMLKLILTDGETYAQAIESCLIPAISREKTPPGSKIFLNNVKILNGFLILNPVNTKLLGGKVPHLYEKWELAKSVQDCSRTMVVTDGPPAWVNFGCKILTSGDDFGKFENKTKDPTKENLEFETLRQGAIAEVATGAVKKVFGGGVKQPIQNNYRQDNFKVRNDGGKAYNKNKKEVKSGKDEIDERPQKPSDKVSLFDFLEDKLNITETTAGAKQKIEESYRSDYSKPAFDNKKNSYKYNDKGYLNQRSNYPKQEYSNYSEKKFNNPREPSKGWITNRREPNKSQDYFNVNRHDGQRESLFNKDLIMNKRDLNRNQDQIGQNKHEIRSEFSYNKDSEMNRREPYKNPENVNLHKYDISNEDLGVNKKKPIKNEEQPNKYNAQFNKDPIMTKKDANKNYENSFSIKQGKPENNQTNSLRDSARFSRNEKERINDSWHYRAPDKAANTVPLTHTDHLSDAMSKMSMNSEFASRSLRQHLNLDMRKPPPPIQNSFQISQSADSKKWNVGDQCLAKYWEDDKFYPAKITAFTETTYVVQFEGYGNIEEVLKTDCLPPKGQDRGDDKRQNKGTLKFRRAPRKFNPS